MIVNYDTFKDFEVPKLKLCRADNSPIGYIPYVTNLKADFEFGAVSEMTFDVYCPPEGIEALPEQQTGTRIYDHLDVGMQVFLDSELPEGVTLSDSDIPEDRGFFMIRETQENESDEGKYKSIVAYSCEYELTKLAVPYIGEKDGSEMGSHVLYNPKDFTSGGTINGAITDTSCIMKRIMSVLPGWTIRDEYVDESLRQSSYGYGSTRKFETSDGQTIWGFLMEDVQSAFECVFLFDIVNRRIHIRTRANALKQSTILLSRDNLVDNITVKKSDDDYINCLLVTGSSNVSISFVNPLGDNKIYHFSQHDYNLMSESLRNKIQVWQERVEAYALDGTVSNDKKIPSLPDNYTYYYWQKQMSVLNTQLTASLSVLNNAKSLYEIARSNYLSFSSIGNSESMPNFETLKSEAEQEMNNAEAEVTSAQSAYEDVVALTNGYQEHINAIVNALDLSNVLTSSEYNEFLRLLKVYSYKNDYITINKSTGINSTAKYVSSSQNGEPFASYQALLSASSSISGNNCPFYTNGAKRKPLTGDYCIVSQDETHSNQQSIYICSGYPTTAPSWTYFDNDEKFAQHNRLYQTAKDILQKLSDPRCETTLETENFIFAKEYEHLAKQAGTGVEVSIERSDGEIVKNYMLKLSLDYTQQTHTIELSNRYRLNDPISIFEDTYGNASSIASISVDMFADYKAEKEKIGLIQAQIEGDLDLTQRKIFDDSSRQETVIDSTGVLVRKYDDAASTAEQIAYDPNQLKITGGSIMFTDDGWETSTLAIGRYWNSQKGVNGGFDMGILGGVIMANSITSTKLKVGEVYSGTNLVRDGSFNENGMWWRQEELGLFDKETNNQGVQTVFARLISQQQNGVITRAYLETKIM